MVPRSVVAAAAGLLYGAAAGSAYVIVGALMGAVVSFEIGHRLGRDFLRGRPWLATVDRVLERRGVIAVLVVRLIPVAPFGLASYAFGATAVRRLPFLTATALGIGPSTVIFANLGANALRPTSPAFIVSALAAITFAVVGLIGARVVIRRGFHERTGGMRQRPSSYYTGLPRKPNGSQAGRVIAPQGATGRWTDHRMSTQDFGAHT